MTSTKHVILATYGEPPTASFTDQLAYSWRILLGLTRKVAAIPKPVLPIIAVSRARGRRALWRANDYGSPLEAITAQQATALQAYLAAAPSDDRWRVHVGYEYRRPLVADVLAALPADEAAFIVPLYAADSAFTHELTREAVDGQRRQASVLRAFAPDVLARASAEHVLTLLADKPEWQGERVALVLAAHGTVLNPPTPIDTGLVATEALCNAMRTQLAEHFGMVVNGWLNHTRGGQWTEPPIEVALERVVAAGFTKVVYYPYGFLGDNAESELEGRLALQQQPTLETRHLPCLNDSTLLLDLMARQLRQCAATCTGTGAGTKSPRIELDCDAGCRPVTTARGRCQLCAAPASAHARG